MGGAGQRRKVGCSGSPSGVLLPGLCLTKCEVHFPPTLLLGSTTHCLMLGPGGPHWSTRLEQASPGPVCFRGDS